jgi:hypothetical protein
LVDFAWPLCVPSQKASVLAMSGGVVLQFQTQNTPLQLALFV